jgi:hypothetical protein
MVRSWIALLVAEDRELAAKRAGSGLGVKRALGLGVFKRLGAESSGPSIAGRRRSTRSLRVVAAGLAWIMTIRAYS